MGAGVAGDRPSMRLARGQDPEGPGTPRRGQSGRRAYPRPQPSRRGPAAYAAAGVPQYPGRAGCAGKGWRKLQLPGGFAEEGRSPRTNEGEGSARAAARQPEEPRQRAPGPVRRRGRACGGRALG